MPGPARRFAAASRRSPGRRSVGPPSTISQANKWPPTFGLNRRRRVPGRSRVLPDSRNSSNPCKSREEHERSHHARSAGVSENRVLAGTVR